MNNTRVVEIAGLANAVVLWLGYISAVGREYVLSEGSIRFPAAEYLEGRHVKDITLEYGHPKLSNKRIDLYFSQDPQLVSAIEFKYIKNGSTRKGAEKQRVFDDLMRLLLFNSNNHKAYFLVCGRQHEFVSNFQNIEPKQDNRIQVYTVANAKKKVPAIGFYTEWFSFDVTQPSKVINLETREAEYRKIYDTFFTRYRDPYYEATNNELVMPEGITTRLEFLSRYENHQTVGRSTFAVGVWEVLLNNYR